MSQQAKAGCKPGGQPGNKNAAKEITAKRTNVRLYPEDNALAKAIAKELGTSRDEAIRRGIKLLATQLNITSS